MRIPRAKTYIADTHRAGIRDGQEAGKEQQVCHGRLWKKMEFQPSVERCLGPGHTEGKWGRAQMGRTARNPRRAGGWEQRGCDTEQ